MLNPSNRKWLPPQMPLQLSSTSKFHNFYVPALNVNKTTFSLNNDYKNCIYSNHVKIDSKFELKTNCVKSNDLFIQLCLMIWAEAYLEKSCIWNVWNRSFQSVFYDMAHTIWSIWFPVYYMVHIKLTILIGLEYIFDHSR